jgi:glycosyltransferase involved in cell wall biosynthesis
MSMGLPVVGYDTGALSEILGDKKALVPYGDISGLADLIVETASDAERKAKWGSENKERMKDRFSIENMIAAYTNLYDNILVTHGSI